MNKATIVPGDTIRFKKGQSWRGQLVPKSGSEGNPVIYTSYGEGDQKPRFLGSVPLDQTSNWIDQGNHLWATVPDTIEPGQRIEMFESLTWGLHREGGAEATFNVESPPGASKTYRITCEASGSRSNHIQLIVRGFKVEAGKHYLVRFSARSTQPFSPASISFSEPGAPWGTLGSVIRLPKEITSTEAVGEILLACRKDHDSARITISLGGALPKGAVFQFTPLELREATLESNGINTDVGNIILDHDKAAFKRWTREELKEQDDFLYDPETSRVWFYSTVNPAVKYKSLEAALHRHLVDHGNGAHIHFIGLDLRYGAAHGFGGTKARHCVYRDLDISWIGGADQYREGGKGRRVRFGNGIEFWSDANDCLVENCRLWEIYDAALTNQGSGVNREQNIVYRNNTIWNCEYSFEYWNRGPESITDNVVFENNACFDAGFGWGHRQRPDKNGRHVMIYANTARTTRLVIRNNVFCTATESPVRIDADFRDGMTMDGNRYGQSDGGVLFRWLNKESFTTDRFEEYREKVGFDRNSTLEKIDRRNFPGLPEEVVRRPSTSGRVNP